MIGSRVKASGPSSCQVHFKSLLVIIVVVASQLFQETSEHLCGLWVLLLEPLKDILDATLND